MEITAEVFSRAFEEEFGPMVVRIACKRQLSMEDSRDYTMAAWGHIWRYRHLFDETRGASLMTWIRLVALREVDEMMALGINMMARKMEPLGTEDANYGGPERLPMRLLYRQHHDFILYDVGLILKKMESRGFCNEARTLRRYADGESIRSSQARRETRGAVELARKVVVNGQNDFRRIASRA